MPSSLPRLPLLLALPLLALACAGTSPEPATPTAPDAAEPRRADPPAAAAEGEEVFSNTIRWTTASELDNFGFDVFRAESPDGPFERLNPEVVQGAGTTDETREYRWVDEEIDPRKTYWYYVESISMSGDREQFTPVGKAPPKLPSGEETGEDRGEPEPGEESSSDAPPGGGERDGARSLRPGPRTAPPRGR